MYGVYECKKKLSKQNYKVKKKKNIKSSWGQDGRVVREICDCVLRFRDYVRDSIVFYLSLSRFVAPEAAAAHPAPNRG